MSNNLITVDALDFDGIKANIKTFLAGQDVFSDYNFEGSALSTLIDVLAYNLHYHSLYTNLALNESFLDSASKYSSAVSLAKTIGYTAKSPASAIAKIRVELSDVTGAENTTLTLPKGTLFKGTVGNNEYVFQTYYAKTATLTNNKYVYEVDVIEGSFISTSYVNNLGSTFVIPNKNADISSMSVKVQKSVSDVSTNAFTRATDLLSITGSDNVYFVKQREDLFYEVYFGNGVIGSAIPIGSVVYLDYYISSGSAANNAGGFYYSGGFRSDALYKVTTLELAKGGADAESIESIKYNAPRNYIAQNRAVTEKDYITQVLQNFPSIESVSVWGGEDNNPPRYGSVYICAKPFSRLALTSDEKKEIRDFMRMNKSMLSIDPILVDPTYTNVIIKTGVYFNPDKTTKTADDISSMIKTMIMNYVNSLNSLKKSFRYSHLVSMIDAAEPSITSNITSIGLKQKVDVNIGVSQRYTLRLNNPITAASGTVKSTRFYLPGSTSSFYFGNTESGDLNVYEILGSGATQLKYKIGSVDFTNGIISIDSITISGLFDSDFAFTIDIPSYDIIPLRDSIITIDYPDCQVDVYVDYDNAATKTFSSIK